MNRVDHVTSNMCTEPYVTLRKGQTEWRNKRRKKLNSRDWEAVDKAGSRQLL